MNRRLLWIVFVLGMVAVACRGGVDSAGMDAQGGTESAGAPAAARAQNEMSRPDSRTVGLSGTATARGSGTTDADGGDDTAEADDGGGGLGTLSAAALGDKIIKEGTVRVEVAEGTFDEAVRKVSLAAESLGGAVVAMSTDQDDDEAPSGSVTVRVPVEEYDALLIGVGEFGTVRSRSISSQDVTTEYVDLESRLRQAQAQERFYLGLLERAEDVEDAIAVQQQLNGLQTDIEQITGRLRFLDRRTEFSTLNVELFEPGAPRVVTTPPTTEPSLARYWDTAREAFVNVVGTVLVTVVSIAPLLVLLALAYLAWRSLRARPSRAAAAPTE